MRRMQVQFLVRKLGSHLPACPSSHSALAHFPPALLTLSQTVRQPRSPQVSAAEPRL